MALDEFRFVAGCHPSRSLAIPTTAYVVRSPTPPDFKGELIPMTHALLRPRKFFEDHHVILTKLLGHA